MDITMETIFKILYENDDLIAMDKPAGISTIPERNREKNCFLHLIRKQVQQPVMTVHRLDKEVSGVIVFAKNPAAHKRFNMLFDQRQVHKTYVAIIHGCMADDQGEIRKPIRQFGSGRMGVDMEKGKPSITQFDVKQKSERYSKVMLYPLTGKRHQLRVHLYDAGHAIVGDPLYGDKHLQSQFHRLMLHAHKIEFEWEGMGHLEIESAVPEVMDRFEI